MAKDGTNRGGRRIGAGRKQDALDKKILEGRAEVPNILEVSDTAAMPPIPKYITAKQKNGVKLHANEIFVEIWQWLQARNCENLVDSSLVEQYAMVTARWRQCEEFISAKGLTGEHPTTGGEMASVYVKMSQEYLKIASQLRYQIYQSVKENATMECSVTNDGNIMEMLLRTQR